MQVASSEDNLHEMSKSVFLKKKKKKKKKKKEKERKSFTNLSSAEFTKRIVKDKWISSLIRDFANNNFFDLARLLIQHSNHSKTRAASNKKGLLKTQVNMHIYLHLITKTRLFKYIEHFTSKSENFQLKNSDIFHISAQNIDCGYSLEPPRWGGSNEYP